MISENLAHGDSVIHGMDPAVRILSAVVISLGCAFSRNLAVLSAYLVIGVVLIFSARLRMAMVFKRLKPLFWFILMIWVLLPVTFEGEPLYKIGSIILTKPGVELCMTITVKSVAILLVFMSLVVTMTVPTLGDALHRLRLPHKIIFLLLMTYRYIAVIEDEYRRLLRAARFRGFTPGTNLHSYQTYAYLAGMLFVRASLRAERVHKAMICRGFNGTFHTLDLFSPHPLNHVFFGCITLVTLLMAITELFWI